MNTYTKKLALGIVMLGALSEAIVSADQPGRRNPAERSEVKIQAEINNVMITLAWYDSLSEPNKLYYSEYYKTHLRIKQGLEEELQTLITRTRD